MNPTNWITWFEATKITETNQQIRYKDIFVFINIAIWLQTGFSENKKEEFTAAVFEHIPISGSLGYNPEEAKLTIHQNMDIYETWA